MHAVHLELLLQKVLLQLLELSMRESVFIRLIVFSSIGQQVHCASTVSTALFAVCTCFALRRCTYSAGDDETLTQQTMKLFAQHPSAPYMPK